MAIVKVVPKVYPGKADLIRVIQYVAGEGKKKKNVMARGGINILLSTTEFIAYQFWKTKEIYEKTDGRLLTHYVISFDNKGIDEIKAIQITESICQIFGGRFQIFWGVHTDTDNLHVHFIINSVSFVDGRKYSFGPPQLARMKQEVNMLEHVLLCNPYNGRSK